MVLLIVLPICALLLSRLDVHEYAGSTITNDEGEVNPQKLEEYLTISGFLEVGRKVILGVLHLA